MPTGSAGAATAATFPSHDDPLFAGEGALHDGNLIDDALPNRLIHRRYADLTEIEGDFACAAWNRDAQTLILARDVFGIRPLFYAHRPNRFTAFCSLSLPLADAGLASRARDEVTVAAFQMWDFRSSERTYLRDIRRVPSAHVVEIRAGQVDIRRYWSLKRKRGVAGRPDSETVARTVRKLIGEAVRKRLPPSGPAATHLSGGLDSSTIATIAAAEKAAGGETVLGCFVAAREREGLTTLDGSRHVAALAQRTPALEVATFEWQPTRSRLLGTYRDDFPIAMDDGGSEWAQTLEEVGRRGIPVCLSGYGGDETVSARGRGGFFEAVLSGKLSRARELAHEQGRPAWRVLARELVSRTAPSPVVRWLRHRAGAPELIRDQLRRYLTPEGRRLIRPETEPWTARGFRISRLTGGILASNAEQLATLGARYGVAVAFPFLDRAIVDYTLDLPEDAFNRDGVQRRPLRDAMDGELPEMIRARHEHVHEDGAIFVDLLDMRDEAVAEIDRLENTPAARLFDLAQMRRALAGFPNRDAAASQIEAAARDDEVVNFREAYVFVAIMAARFYAQGAADIAED